MIWLNSAQLGCGRLVVGVGAIRNGATSGEDRYEVRIETAKAELVSGGWVLSDRIFETLLTTNDLNTAISVTRCIEATDDFRKYC